MPYLLDADLTIEALGGRPRALTILRRLRGQQISISWVTVAEIYEGAFDSANPEAHLEVFRQFLAPFAKVSLNEPIVERIAELRAWLRRRGEPIPDFDIVLAATALH